MKQEDLAVQALFVEHSPKVVVVMAEQKLRFNLQTAAALLDCSDTYLRTLAQHGKVAHHREGKGSNRRYFFTRENLRT